MYNKNNDLFEPYQGFIRGNMFKNIFVPFGKIYEIKPMNEQAELLTYIDMLEFACIDIGLYLDIYPDNEQMIQVYNQLREEKKKWKRQYEDSYGPLTLGSKALNVSPWAWDDNPWPWEV